jgi:hypothetical protein
MKFNRFAAAVLFVSILLSACQKELDFGADGISSGKLLKDLSNNCQPVTINGLFKVDSVLTNNNYVDVQVDVSVKGTFDIKSDTVNGYSFSRTGSVVKGINTIRLYASGKPIATGINIFTIKYGATTCSFAINAITNPAIYTLGGSPATCTGFVLAGTYNTGIVLTAGNTVTVNVNVTTPGAYTISTNTVNGFFFSASGMFTTTGSQTVVLTANGTPAAAGNFNFSVSGSGNSCSFAVACSSIPVANLDYIPQTSFSNWSSRVVGGTPSDTTYVQVNPNNYGIGGISYRIFEIKDQGVPTDSIFQRKNGGMYYQLYDGDYGIFDNPFNKDGLILDSSLAVNASWTITLGNNTVGGLPVSVKINCQIIEKNATATIAGNNYTNIIKVKYSYVGNVGLGDIVFAEEERWYARGFGLIYDKINDVPVTTTTELETTRIQIF